MPPPTLPQLVIDFLKSASTDEKRHLHHVLSVDLGIKEMLNNSTISVGSPTFHTPSNDTSPFSPASSSSPTHQRTATPKPSTPLKPHDVTAAYPSPSKGTDKSNYLEHVDLNISEELSDNIWNELSQLKLRSRGSKGKPAKIKTQWLSTTDAAYNYANVKNTPKPIDDFPYIKELMGHVNQHPSTTQNMCAALVSCMSNPKVSLGLHSDDEELIDQQSSICTVSFGPPRSLEFVYNTTRPFIIDGVKEFPTDVSLPCINGTMNIMKPGCQQLMRHRVPQGTQPGPRYSISFRNIVPQADSPPTSAPKPKLGTTTSPKPSPQSSPHPPKTTPKKKVILLAGDSFFERLDVKKLSKGKQTVVKISRGGRKICDVEEAVRKYVDANPDIEIKKLFICVGTNNISNNKEGISHLKSSLCNFIKSMKLLCPVAKIWFQSLLPMPTNGSIIFANNIMQFNYLVYNLCSRYKIFYLDVFSSFLDSQGLMNTRLFPPPNAAKGRVDIHPNSKGMGVLARHYIFLIHSRWFNPLAY